MPTVLAAEEVWALEVSREVTFGFKSLEGGFVLNVHQTSGKHGRRHSDAFSGLLACFLPGSYCGQPPYG